jgi:hypothetical protein
VRRHATVCTRLRSAGAVLRLSRSRHSRSVIQQTSHDDAPPSTTRNSANSPGNDAGGH